MEWQRVGGVDGVTLYSYIYGVCVCVCATSLDGGKREIYLPHHFSINNILWPFVELNLSPMSLLECAVSDIVRDHTGSSFFHFNSLISIYIFQLDT